YPPVAASLPTLTCADFEAVHLARGDAARVARGWGRVDLYSWSAPQRARPTAQKYLESNRVLTPKRADFAGNAHRKGGRKWWNKPRTGDMRDFRS
ncbi:hypothetical protein, partial [Mobiluncus sp.]|uniref:hypothetical protein n=1 Tax=Mobiluncus sp. TaxID=47293 RepID=UPI002A91F860